MFRVQFEFQLADAEVSLHDSEHWVSFGSKIGSVLSILDKKIIVNRTNMEKPDLLLQASINSSSVFSTGYVQNVQSSRHCSN